MYNKKTWTNYFVYAFEVSPNTIAPYTSKSPRDKHVSISYYSWCFFKFGEFQKQEQQANASSNMSAHPSTLVDIRMDAAKIVNKIDSVELKFHNSYFLMHNFDNSCVFIFKNSTFCSLNQDNM